MNSVRRTRPWLAATSRRNFIKGLLGAAVVGAAGGFAATASGLLVPGMLPPGNVHDAIKKYWPGWNQPVVDMGYEKRVYRMNLSQTSEVHLSTPLYYISYHLATGERITRPLTVLSLEPLTLAVESPLTLKNGESFAVNRVWLIEP